jgi:hypothetical protein
MDWSLVSVVLLGIHGFLMIYCFLRLLAVIQASITNLDHTIAEAIKSVIQQGGGDFEPINPVQAAIASFIQTRLGEGSSEVKPIQARQPDGKFE